MEKLTREDIIMKLDELSDYLEQAIKKTEVTLDENQIALEFLKTNEFEDKVKPLFERMATSLETVNEKQEQTFEGYKRSLEGINNLKSLVNEHDIAVEIYNAMLLLNGE